MTRRHRLLRWLHDRPQVRGWGLFAPGAAWIALFCELAHDRGNSTPFTDHLAAIEAGIDAIPRDVNGLVA